MSFLASFLIFLVFYFLLPFSFLIYIKFKGKKARDKWLKIFPEKYKPPFAYRFQEFAKFPLVYSNKKNSLLGDIAFSSRPNLRLASYLS